MAAGDRGRAPEHPAADCRARHSPLRFCGTRVRDNGYPDLPVEHRAERDRVAARPVHPRLRVQVEPALAAE